MALLVFKTRNNDSNTSVLESFYSMAIYHLSVSNISRGQGRSIVAAAAYRSGSELSDERYGKTHDYTRKEDVAHSEIMLPKDAPEWMKDREQLWNTVETIEKRKDARLAREVQISLPRELSLEQNKELAREFVQKNFVDEGMVADLSIHLDKGKDGESQPHVHVLLTTREVSSEGFGMKNADWNKRELLCEWREAWSGIANEHLARHGHDIQIDHRSYQEQGIDLEPQHKIGAVVAQERLARLEDHQRIARENGEKIFEDPKLALNALTRQQSTFTHQDLARFVNRHSENAEQFQKVYEKVKGSDEIVSLGVDEKGRERFSTQEMLKIESRMLDSANKLHEREGHGVEASSLNQASQKRQLTDQQQMALQYLTDRGDLKSVVGYAGTGKSYLLGAAKEAWEDSGYRVRGVALSGIAAQSLEQGSGIESRTVASQFYRWDQGKDQLTSKDILVIDEAGMLGSRQMERLMTEAQGKGSKVVAVGDFQQLQAIEAGGAFRAIAEEHQFIELTEIRRQEVDWQKDATLDLAKGKVEAALEKYREKDHVHHFETQGEAKEKLIDQWNDARITNPQESQIILAYTRKDVKELNDMARDRKRECGELGKDHAFETEKGERNFAAGDRVYFLKRDDQLKVVNGTLGTVRDIEGSKLKVELDRKDLEPKQRLVEVDPKQYKHLDHGYAATVYKAQGVTVDRTYMLTSRHYDAHSSYVGMSRQRQSCDIYVSREEFKSEKSLVATLGRARTKDVTVDYTKPEREFARQRGIAPPAREKSLERPLKEHVQERERTSPELRVQPDKERKFEPPPYEKRALEVDKQFRQYSRDLAQNKLEPRGKAEFERSMAEVAKEPRLMRELKARHPETAKQIEGMAKAQEKGRGRELSKKDLGLER